MRHITLIIAVLALAVAAPAIADKGGNGHGNGGGGSGGGGGNEPTVSASCTVDGNVVNVTGLPTDQVINFMITDASGSWGWVLGYTGDGTWGVQAPARTGSTTYEFVSRTWGPNGSKYDVYASCSA
jgi:hypothetical protein